MACDFSWQIVLLSAAALDAGVILFEAARPDGAVNAYGDMMCDNGFSEALTPPLDTFSELQSPRSPATTKTLASVSR